MENRDGLANQFLSHLDQFDDSPQGGILVARVLLLACAFAQGLKHRRRVRLTEFFRLLQGRFEGRLPRSGAPDRLDKLTFTPMDGGRVHQYWEQSLDAGKTWVVSFDGIYSPRR